LPLSAKSLARSVYPKQQNKPYFAETSEKNNTQTHIISNSPFSFIKSFVNTVLSAPVAIFNSVYSTIVGTNINLHDQDLSTELPVRNVYPNQSDSKLKSFHSVNISKSYIKFFVAFILVHCVVSMQPSPTMIRTVSNAIEASTVVSPIVQASLKQGVKNVAQNAVQNAHPTNILTGNAAYYIQPITITYDVVTEYRSGTTTSAFNTAVAKVTNLGLCTGLDFGITALLPGIGVIPPFNKIVGSSANFACHMMAPSVINKEFVTNARNSLTRVHAHLPGHIKDVNNMVAESIRSQLCPLNKYRSNADCTVIVLPKYISREEFMEPEKYEDAVFRTPNFRYNNERLIMVYYTSTLAKSVNSVEIIRIVQGTFETVQMTEVQNFVKIIPLIPVDINNVGYLELAGYSGVELKFSATQLN